MKDKITGYAAIGVGALCILSTIGLFISAFVLDSKAADVTYTVLNNQTKRLADMGDGTFAEVTAGRAQHLAAIGAVGLSATTLYVLVDLDDIVNYPHTETTTIVVTAVDMEIAADGTQWRVIMGAVADITANTVTVTPVKALTAGTVSFDARLSNLFPGQGVSMDDVIAVDVEIAGITTGTDLASPAGTVNAEVGDLMVIVEESSGTATATFGVLTTYWTK